MSQIELHPAQRDELECIENLMQFFMYEFSEWLPLKLGRHGLFQIQPKTEYWRQPGTRPWLLRVDGELAGFAIVDDQVHFAEAQYNLAYFFVVRRFRGRGIGRQVVRQLLELLPGHWQIFHIDDNRPARDFWARVIPTLVGDAYSCHPITADGYPCTLYKFHTPTSPGQ
ncbi:Predicted acetyltransferase [Pseudomonas sp. NFIX51]|uniref:GNAT family N-acetyltransferase n=1 Tax=unclassified Pseudomonas TaxID=196821 RepID=UPI0008BEF5C8|nr:MULTISPECIES: GNAT family N-acetyltransferase [unclassified Pseudomonas]SEK73245.1 Predicted acetyltransferase [Pseudomonas sp. NFACC41-3]SMH45908.1 Predicted acetyltransferase [Pseudomonas sp. NFIX51]